MEKWKKFPLFLFFLLSILSPNDLHSDRQQVLVEVSPGHAFIGGHPPKIVGVKEVKTVYKNQKPYHMYQVTFRRASYDNGNSWFPLMEAKTWGHLFTSKKVEEDFIVLKWLREKNVDATWNNKFPTLKCFIKYLLAVDTGDGWKPNRLMVKTGKGVTAKPAHRQRHGSNPKQLVTEYLVMGLPPGSHRLELRANAKYDENHPFTKGKNIAEWIKYYFLNKFETLFKKVGEKYYTSTMAVYTINVPARVPMVEGKTITEARKMIRNHFLTPVDDPEYTGDRDKNGKVRLQDPVAGTLIKKGDNVGLTYYEYSPELDEKSPSDALSGVWNWTATCGNSSFSGKFSIIPDSHGLKFTGIFSDGHSGTLTGMMKGFSFKFTRKFDRGSQTWAGTLTGNKITGTVTDNTHVKLKIPTTCTFTATR